MFTGLVEKLGNVLQIDPQGTHATLEIEVGSMVSALAIGDSIAIDGCCLTVIKFKPNAIVVEAVEETLKKTTLGLLKPHHKVNLELALKVGDRLDGHFVQGHVDGVGAILKKESIQDKSWMVYIEAPASIMHYLIEKGSVTVDGVSLTIVDVFATSFSFAMIPHTASHTTLGLKNVGDKVNLEVDILAKHVERQMSQWSVCEKN